MSTDNNRRLSLEEAAEIMFHTSAPTALQVRKVRQLVKQGVLAGTLEGRGTTSTEAIAQYLARAALSKGGSSKKLPRSQERTRQQRDADADMRPLYSDVLTDYFLAVLRRRDSNKRSARFQQAVWVGQMVGVGLLMVLFIWLASGGKVPPAELSVVEHYLKSKDPSASIEEWFPPRSPNSGPGRQIRVKYRHRSAAGPIVEADSVFTIHDSKVLGVAPTPPATATKH